MNTPTVVPLMIWTAYVVWGYIAMAVCQCCVISTRYIGSSAVCIALQLVVGALLVVATLAYNNYYNCGQVRLYILLGMAVGATIYYLVCYRVVEGIVHSIIMRIHNKTNK